VKNPSDFVGSHLGQSEQQTKGILAATLGKVLVIDEAYGLYGGGGTQGGISDPYKTAVIDTIVADVQSVPGDDRCVLLLGYKDQMETMFQNVNPGLSRRFPIASGFNFEDFSDDELRKIFELKVKQQGYQATDQAANVAMEMLKRAQNRPNFGNAGEIDILLDATKARHQTRFSKREAKSRTLLEALDFDENFDRAERADTNVRKLFEGTVGCEQIVSLLKGYQDTVRTLKSLEMDPKDNIPFNFLFRGPPGTGKTTTAKKMGKVFYDMGFLAAAEVVECSATDLIGQYVGQTGPKVQQLFDKALGKVLFVDEAYRLAEGHYAKEAMDEIVDSVTKDRYFKKLVIILAGYEADINRLMSVNSGLTSRFPEVIDFTPLAAEECVALLTKLLRHQKNALKSKGKVLDLCCLEQPATEFKQVLLQSFTLLAEQDNWASARDVQGLAKGIFNNVLRDKDGLAQGCLTLTEDTITGELQSMIQERASRASSAKRAPSIQPRDPSQQQPAAPDLPPSLPTYSTATSTAASTATSTTIFTARAHTQPPVEDEESPKDTLKHIIETVSRTKPPTTQPAKRDAGVSDEVWEQLQRDREAEEQREEVYRKLKDAARKATEAAREAIVKRLVDEKEQQDEEERQRKEAARKAAEEAKERITRWLQQAEERRKKEEAVKKRLKEMGACPMGYDWIKQNGGWRCAGGSHWLGDGQLGL
jgi:SpoVK/Ycf46/Vps4 family AAA+-type ATPase